MKAAIVYASLSNNTQDLAYMIAEEIKQHGGEVDLFYTGLFPVDYRMYDIVLFGSYTWGDGELPLSMRRELQHVLLGNKGMKPLVAAVFGTGDTQYKFYCRAVDEMRYHLQKHNVIVVGEPLKIEQNCKGKQIQRMKDWTKSVIGAINNEN
jgi:flavodoxin I